MSQYMQNIKRNVIFGFVARIVQTLFPFIIRKFIVKQLGIEYIGINGLFGSIFSILTLAELGVGGALTYMLYKPIAENDQKMINGILNLYRKCYMVIGGIVLTLGLLIIPFLPFLVKDGYPSEINIYVIYIINLFGVVVSYWIYAYEVSLISAYQREDVLLKINLIMFTIQSIVQILVLVVYSNYYMYIIVAPIISIVANLLVGYFGKKMFQNCQPIGMVSTEVIAEIKEKVKGILFHKIAGITFESIDGIVISAYIGLVASGIYNNYWSLLLSLSAIFSMFANAIRASLANLLIKKDVNDNYNIFLIVDVFFSLLLGWVVICLVCAFQPFVNMWLGPKNMLENSVVFLIILSFYVSKISYTVNLYKSATGLWSEDKYRPVVMSLLNIILSVILVKYMGVAGTIFATMIVVIFVSIPWETKVLFTWYFKSGMLKYYIQKFINTFIIFITGILAYYLCSFIHEGGILEVILKLCIGSSVYAVIVLLFYIKKIKIIINLWRSENYEWR